MTEVWHRWAARVAIGASLAIAVLGAAQPATAAWSTNGSGSVAGAAASMPTGKTPSVSASGGSSVTVTWTAATIVTGVNVAGYTIKRYDPTTQAQATVGSGCSGTITATTCTELNVPAGSWVYTDTPVQMNWTGGQSAQSSTVVTTS
jgi:hypothetical protein